MRVRELPAVSAPQRHDKHPSKIMLGHRGLVSDKLSSSSLQMSANEATAATVRHDRLRRLALRAGLALDANPEELRAITGIELHFLDLAVAHHLLHRPP